jgi:hypothetical protein
MDPKYECFQLDWYEKVEWGSLQAPFSPTNGMLNSGAVGTEALSPCLGARAFSFTLINPDQKKQSNKNVTPHKKFWKENRNVTGSFLRRL